MRKIKLYALLLSILALSSTLTAMESQKRARFAVDSGAAAAASAVEKASARNEQFDYLDICNTRCSQAEKTSDLEKLREIEKQAHTNMHSYQRRIESFLCEDTPTEQQEIQSAHDLMLGWKALYYRTQLSKLGQHILHDQQTFEKMKTDLPFAEFKKYCEQKSDHIRTRFIPDVNNAQQAKQLERYADIYDQLAQASAHPHDAGGAAEAGQK